MIKMKFQFICENCGKVWSPDEVKYLCPECEKTNTTDLPPKGILKVLYDYERLVKEGFNFEILKNNGFLEILPIRSAASLPNLRIGQTPFYRMNDNLYLKDDAQQPTFSFKDRASAIVSAYAKEHGWETIVTASTGNAGSSLAGICAAQHQKAVIVVPEKAPLAKLAQIIMYGAQIVPVAGNYDQAFDLSIEASAAFGWYNRNTGYNPLTIEGKKTVAFEIFDDFGQKVPDRIFVSVGDGVIISGVYKGFEDLMRLKITDRMPQIVAVQAEGSDNLIRNLQMTDFRSRPGSTIADSISVDIPRNFHMAAGFIQKYDGGYLTVSDEEILNASLLLSQTSGIFTEPASAAAYAGFLSFRDDYPETAHSANVVLLTGSGLKDIAALKPILSVPKAILPTIDALKQLLK
jgi:threonine synthase